MDKDRGRGSEVSKGMCVGESDSQNLQVQIFTDFLPIPPLQTLITPPPALLDDLMSGIDIKTTLGFEPLEKVKEPTARCDG